MAKILKYLQGRLVPEIELLKINELCNDDEIRIIQSKREQFLYRIRQLTPKIVDYIEYITYERELLAKINRRAKRKLVNITEINEIILYNIKKLYNEGLILFPEDLRFWQAFIIFLKFANLLSVVSTAFEDMLMHHGDKSEVWLQAGLWEYKEVYNIERVQTIFLCGLQQHPENESLHEMYFKIMLEEAAKLTSELNLQDYIASGQSVAVARVIIIYENFKNSINNIEYSCKLLKICEKYLFTQKLQKVIVDDIMNKFANLPITWNTLAQRELNGFNICDLMDRPDDELAEILLNKSSVEPMEIDENNCIYNDSFESSLAPRKRTSKRRIELCFEVYVTAVNKLHSEEMWNYFLKAMLELNKNLSTQKNLKRSKLSQAFHEAQKANYMSEKHYITYIELIRDSTPSEDETLVEILKTATTLYPASVLLWDQYMSFYIRKDNHNELEEIFLNACVILGDEAVPLWKKMLQYYLNHFDLLDKIESLFEMTCVKTSEKFVQLRLLYLEYNLKSKPIEDVRQLYKKIVCNLPPCMELYEEMIFLDQERLKPDIDKWRQCHDYATHYFGKNSVSAWIDYLRFEQTNGNPQNLPIVLERAKEALDTKYIDQLIYESSSIINI